MATFKTRIEGLLKSGSDDIATTYLNDYLTATAGEVLQILPETEIIRYAQQAQITNADGYSTLNKRILALVRKGYSAQEVPFGLSNQISDSNSIHFAGERTPVYYYDADKIYLKPDPSGSAKGTFKFIDYPTVAHGDSSITGYPETAEYAVVLGACVKYLAKELNDTINDKEDVELSTAIKNQLDTIMGMYQAEIQRLTGMK